MNIPKYVDELRKELQLKNYAFNTIKSYCNCLELFLKYYNSKFSEPKKISTKEIKEYLRKSKSVSVLKQNISSLKFFYKNIIRQPLKFKYIEYPRKENKLPKIIDKQELSTKIEQIKNLKHKAIISVAYCCALRVSEVINIKITDIDSKRMLIHVRNAKGNKDRYVPISNNLLKTLRDYYTEYKPDTYLFNGQKSLKYSSTSCNNIVKKYLDKEYHFHLLRHSGLTHMLENKTDIRILQIIAGHNNIDTTSLYCHVSTELLNTVNLPL